ncbi:unnamed protein product [Paramecium sonneborni]|uniref:Uncharacterized protein n=1 Tax=Paramecium sonneborni TaxID=65129 RepID=A0A8S1R310_9CILI|nr:unnamed protein product [Paramecium sonneborni]
MRNHIDQSGFDYDQIDKSQKTLKGRQEQSVFEVWEGNFRLGGNLCHLKELHIDLRECVIDCNYNQQEFGLFLQLKNFEMQSMEMIKKNRDNQIYKWNENKDIYFFNLKCLWTTASTIQSI